MVSFVDIIVLHRQVVSKLTNVINSNRRNEHDIHDLRVLISEMMDESFNNDNLFNLFIRDSLGFLNSFWEDLTIEEQQTYYGDLVKLDNLLNSLNNS